MDIFPTPKKIVTLSEELWRLPAHPCFRLCCRESDTEVRRTVRILCQEIRRAFPGCKFTAGSKKAFAIELQMECGLTAEQPEAYELTVSAGKIVLNGAGWRGLLYAGMTLCQMAYECGEYTGLLPQVAISDYPDIRYRVASRWLIGLDCTRRAYDWGDGPAATQARYRHKIDFAMRYKINTVFFEGFLWDRKKYPGYCADMRALNRYAADRNVILNYSGLGIGAAGRDPRDNCTNFNRGLGGLNRRSYPDGELYKCCGMDENHPTRFDGTCRSNETLNRLKQEDLADYVRRIEPRMLYIHHEDSGDYEFSARDWSWRCDECRKRWPGEYTAKDGGAGALAHGMNALYQAVASVKNPVSGYDGARDCQVVLISPFYGGLRNDEDWRLCVELWRNVCALLPATPNIKIGLRELFRNRGDNSRRLPQFADAIRANGGHGVFVFSINGADNFLDDAPFAAGALMNSYYREADMIFNFSGALFQEPQEVFNAECCWNLPPDDWHTADEAEEAFRTYVYDRFIPVELTAEDGFLSRFCRHYYGRHAGKVMLQYQQLGYNLTPGVSCTPLSIMFYRFLREGLFQRSVDFADYDLPALLIKWKGILAQTEKAHKLIVSISQKVNDYPGAESVKHLERCLALGALIAKAAVTLFSASPDWDGVLRLINRATRFMDSRFSNDYPWSGDGDGALWGEYFDRFRRAVAYNRKDA